MALISFLDNHQGTASIALTLVTVVLTLVYVIANLRIVAYMKRNLEHAETIHLEETRPFVIFDLISEDREIKSLRTNIGRRPAYDVRIKVEPPLIVNYKVGDKGPTTFEDTVIPWLPPGRRITDFLNMGHAFLKDNAYETFTASVTYKDVTGKEWSETAHISGEYLRNLAASNADDPMRKVAQESERMRITFDGMRTEMTNLAFNANHIQSVLQQAARQDGSATDTTLTPEEKKYLIEICSGDQPKIAYGVMEAFGAENDPYRTMLEKFVRAGLMYRAVDSWRPTAEGQRVASTSS